MRIQLDPDPQFGSFSTRRNLERRIDQWQVFFSSADSKLRSRKFGELATVPDAVVVGVGNVEEGAVSRYGQAAWLAQLLLSSISSLAPRIAMQLVKVLN
jgi:hypothetical protein